MLVRDLDIGLSIDLYILARLSVSWLKDIPHNSFLLTVVYLAFCVLGDISSLAKLFPFKVLLGLFGDEGYVDSINGE